MLGLVTLLQVEQVLILSLLRMGLEINGVWCHTLPQNDETILSCSCHALQQLLSSALLLFSYVQCTPNSILTVVELRCYHSVIIIKWHHYNVKEDTTLPVDIDTISVGSIISYRLPASQLPVDKNKLWRGKVLKVISHHPRLLDSVIVESLEAGYEKETEWVLLEHIAALETQEENT